MPGPITNFKKGHELQQRFHSLVPGGSHTYSKGEDQFPYLSPQIISHAKDVYCWDLDGNRYIDWAMGNRVFILGHGDETVNNAVKDQIDKGLNFTRPGILEYELAEYLTSLWPVAEMVKFGKNGSDVTTAAVKISRAYTGREHVAVCKQHPFFSIHDWFISTTVMDNGIVESDKKYSHHFNYNDIDSLKRLFEEFPGQISCVILEPVKNDAPNGSDNSLNLEGILESKAKGRKTFLHEVRELCTREGAVLIFDEMISGIRFDIHGAHHLYGVYPDLATFGKCISNGYSCSVLAGKKDILELGGLQHNKKRTFLLSQTHGSETVGLAATLATLKKCEQININSHTWQLGSKMKNEFRKLADSLGVTDYVRIIGFDCNPQILCTHEDGSYWPELHTSFHEEVISWGVIIPWISICAAHNESHLQTTLEALGKGMEKVKKIVDAGTVLQSFTGNAVKPVFREYNK